MLENIKCLGHSTIKMLDKDKVIYIDPYNIKEDKKDADIIFITHAHYDHFSEEDIIKIKNENTIIVITEDIYNKVIELGFLEKKIIKVMPKEEYKIGNIRFQTIPAYNIDKKFHPKENMWVGYLININNIRYYIAGDTDITNENKKVKCDVAFLPVGGTYTMNYKEAAELANTIKPKIAIPTHYGSVVGAPEDGQKFVKNLDEGIEGIILM